MTASTVQFKCYSGGRSRRRVSIDEPDDYSQLLAESIKFVQQQKQQRKRRERAMATAKTATKPKPSTKTTTKTTTKPAPSITKPPVRPIRPVEREAAKAEAAERANTADPMVTTSIALPRSLHRRVMVYALDHEGKRGGGKGRQHSGLRGVVIEAVEEWLADRGA